MKNFTGYVNLSDTIEYQEIYSSQLYGTFFSVFGVFNTTTNQNGYNLTRIELQIINYKGVLDIGITGVEMFEVGERRFILKLEVQALNGVETCDLICEDLELPNDSEILIDRRLKKMHPDCSAFRNGLFDIEFYYREGGDVYPERQPKPLEWGEELPPKVIEDFLSENVFKGDSQCPRRRIKIS